MIYLDNASTTPTDLRVIQKMLPYFGVQFGNPSSIYKLGLEAKAALDNARSNIAKFLNANLDEIIFTSGGTESDNLAIMGLARAFKINKKSQTGHIITTQIEHMAVLNSCRALEREGFKITYLPVSKEGIVDPKDVKKAIRDDTILVSIMYANNEIGTIQPIAEIAKIVAMEREKRQNLFSPRHPERSEGSRPKDVLRSARFLDKSIINLRKIFAYHSAKSGMTQDPNIKNRLPTTDYRLLLLHTDACQAAGYLEMNVQKLGVDLLSFNGSKIYGPKGIGVLFIKSGVEIEPIILGGHQERGLRAGTENVPAIVGLSEAVKLINFNHDKESELRDYMTDKLLKIKGAELNGHKIMRLPNNINISFKDVEGESAVLYLDKEEIACSTGSACLSRTFEPSHVITALRKSKEVAHCSLRFTLGRNTTKKEIDFTVAKIRKVVKKLRVIGSKNE